MLFDKRNSILFKHEILKLTYEDSNFSRQEIAS